jgi:4-hydroxy-3-methylbut-2-enyl diphosphate reductase
MKVILAQPRGFCAGVVRAVEIVERAIDLYGAPVYVRHEIVHNRFVVQALERRGARFVTDLDEVPDRALVIFSAHGVPRAVYASAAARQLPVIDATCPLVTKIHNQVRNYVVRGRALVLIGHAGHPEVEGTLGQIDGPAYLVQNEADVHEIDLPADAPVAYVTQTTLSVHDTRAIIAALKRRFTDIVGPETRDICYATQNRQSAVRNLARLVDLILVVGAANSSNSNRLREIGAEIGVPSYLIADAAELDRNWFGGIRTIGVTAGASAPEHLVEGVVDALDRMAGPIQVSTLSGIEETMSFRLPAVVMDAAAHRNRRRDGG